MQYLPTSVADTYNCGAYGAGDYNTNSCSSSTSTTSSSGSSSGGILTNTGFDILLAATLACVIIFMALMIRFWRKPRSGSPNAPTAPR